jgi:hypothetical protein
VKEKLLVAWRAVMKVGMKVDLMVVLKELYLAVLKAVKVMTSAGTMGECWDD